MAVSRRRERSHRPIACKRISFFSIYIIFRHLTNDARAIVTLFNCIHMRHIMTINTLFTWYSSHQWTIFMWALIGAIFFVHSTQLSRKCVFYISFIFILFDSRGVPTITVNCWMPKWLVKLVTVRHYCRKAVVCSRGIVHLGHDIASLSIWSLRFYCRGRAVYGDS